MLTNPQKFIQKPSIKRYYGQKLTDGYPQNLIEWEQEILVKNIKNIQSIWPFVSIDIVRNNIGALEIIKIPTNDKILDWIGSNLKLESFLNMLSQHYTKVGCIEIDGFLKDTFNQLEKLLEKKIAVVPPKRWRLIEFHDHISYLYLENTTQNNILKTIIKPYQKGEYKVSQPAKSLDIIIWGKKVKNCVASYEERIGKNLWIFFIEKDGVPLYTVETNIGKTLNINQMVSQCNARVDDAGRKLALELINEAQEKSLIKN